MYRKLFWGSDLYVLYVQMDHFVILNEKSFFDCAMPSSRMLYYYERGDNFIDRTFRTVSMKLPAAIGSNVFIHGKSKYIIDQKY